MHSKKTARQGGPLRFTRGSGQTGCALLLLAVIFSPLGSSAGPIDMTNAIAAAPAGEANGHFFVHLLELDPDSSYVGGAWITEDTCIQGNSATIDLNGQCLVVTMGTSHTRFDIDHCLIVNGGIPGYAAFGGGIEFGESTQGWVVNNTFYRNDPCGLYLHNLFTDDDGVKITNNILFANTVYGLVRHEEKPLKEQILYNDSVFQPFDYARHCGCPSGDPVVISPPDSIDFTNGSYDPLFVRNPNPPKVTGDFHLRPESPCIGTGESGQDLGAFPFGQTPVVPCSWGALKSLFRD